MKIKELATSDPDPLGELISLNPEPGITGNPGPAPGAQPRSSRLPQLALAAAAALAVIVAGVVWSNQPPDQLTVTSADNTQADAADDTTVPQSSAAAPDLEPDRIHADDEPPIAAEATDREAALRSDSIRYLPTSDWELLAYHSDVVVGPFESHGDELTAATADGLWGPVVQAHFNPGVDTLNVGEPGGRITETPNGTRVRVAEVLSNRTLSAVVLAEGGIIASTGWDISEADLLAVVDSIEIVDGVLAWNGDPLPAELTQVTDIEASASNEQINLRRTTTSGDVEQSLHVLSVPSNDWSLALEIRAQHPDAQPATLDGEPALVFSPTPSDPYRAGALYPTEDRIYVATIDNGADSAPPTIDDARATLESVAAQTLADDLDLIRRTDLYSAWSDEIGIPDQSAVEWLFTDELTTAESEASFAHQVFGCVWAGEWIGTGGQAAIDAIDRSGTWPTGLILLEFYEKYLEEDQVPPLFVPTIEDRSASTVEDRATAALQEDCGFAIGHDLFSSPVD